MKYENVIIGGGLSGLAAGIRLAHYGKKVLICEQHSRIGGLNSYYHRKNIFLETGLHAMTNFVSKKAHKSHPLLKLLRQLRIPYDSLHLREQNYSSILFPNHQIDFSNDFSQFETSIADLFPQEIDNFIKLNKMINEYNELDLTLQWQSARKIVGDYIKNPILIDMLFCPLSYYGSATEEDMDFSQFVIMYKSIYSEGFCRPAANGIKTILDILEKRFLESGGHLELSCKVKNIKSNNNEIILHTSQKGKDNIITAQKVLSSAGLIETNNLLGIENTLQTGNLSYIETVAILDNKYDMSAHNQTIIFFNNSDKFSYKKSKELTNFASGVICAPQNFQFAKDDILPDKAIRITALANYDLWNSLSKEHYKLEKNQVIKQALTTVENLSDLKNLEKNSILLDSFTPKTIERYTGHLNGAIYGSPVKNKTGKMSIDNVFLCGTDQGFLGITGSMLSGISMANMYLLR